MKSRFLPAVLLLFASFFAKNLHAQTNISIEIIGPSVMCVGHCDSVYAVVLSQPSPQFGLKWMVTGPNNYNAAYDGMGNIFCAVAPGTYTFIAHYTNDNGVMMTSDTHQIVVSSFLPLDIISSNPAPCNFDSLQSSDDNACEKVCPNTTVTYSVQTGNPPGGTQTSLGWQVTGASSYAVNPPFNNSVTVNWGGPGIGSVSVFTDNNSNCAGEDALCVTVIQEPVAKFDADPAPSGNTVQICKGQTVYFDNQSTGADSYEWAFSDDFSTSSEINPEHVFQNPGNYTVRLIARSDCLCADTTTLNVEVLDAVAPSLDCVGTLCPGATVTYTASNACPPYTWSTTPNGTVLSGGTASIDSITIQWNAGPVGIITLGAQPCSGNACPNPANIRVPIISDDAEIRGEEQVCPAAVEVYSIEAYGGTGFVWSLSGGGTIAEGQGTNRVTVKWTDIPNTNTIYWLSVKYDNCYLGCGGEDSIGVKVLSPFVVNGPVELCENASGNFTSKLTYNAQNIACNWTLFAPDGSVAWTSPAPTANASVPFLNGGGIYRLLAEPDNPVLSCSKQADWAVNVAALPATPTGILGEKNICPGTTYTYSATGVSPANNLRWTVQNGAGAPVVSLGNKINVTWGTATPRWISVAQVSTNGLNCSSDTALLTVQDIGLIFISGPQVVCEDSKANYSVISLENIDLQWKTSPTTAGAVASGQGINAVEIFWTEAGGHVVSLDVCGQTSFLPVTVIAPPDPMVQYSASVCPGQTSSVQTTNSFPTYSWRDVSGTEISTAPTLNLGPGSYAVRVQDPNGCPGVEEFTIAQSPTPNVSITTADPTIFCNATDNVTLTALTNADGNLTYQWFQNGSPIGSNAPVFTTNLAGNYTVQVTTANGCTASAGPIVLLIDCSGGGGGGLPGAGFPPCPPGSVDFSINATATCDSFQFQLIPGPQYLSGSAQWTFGVSGGGVVGTSALENPGFNFPNAGKYIAVLRAALTSGGFCVVIDSVNVLASAQFSAIPDCAGEATVFQDVSTFLPNSGITNWDWNFGDPPSGGNNFSTIRNPSHNYSNPGNALVSLTITANSGCTSSFSQTLDIPGGATANFSAPAQNCAGNALEFSANTTPDMTQLNWNFGDLASGAANDATGTPAYHNFTTPGNYAVTTTTTNAYGCTAVFTEIVNIAPNALSGAITPAAPAPICEGSTLALTAPPGAVSYIWSDSVTTTQVFTANEEGSYSVTMTDANGCTYTPPPVNVEITPSPDALIKALLQNQLGQTIGTSYPTLATCHGEDVNLIIQANGAYSFSWSGSNGFDDNLIFSEDRNNLLSVGTHIFTVTVTDGVSGCTSVTDPFIVTVNPVPVASPVTASGNCAGAANVLTYMGSTPANWQFIWSNGTLGSTLTTENPGLYFIRVINEFGCEAKSDPLAVLPGPNAAAIPGGCHARCKPDTLCLPLIPNIVSWQWYYNGSAIPGANGPDFVATQSGSYYAELTDVFGCTNQSDPLVLNLFDGYGNINGQVWSDVNGNGIVDAGDTLVSGIFVNLLENGNPVGAGQSNAGGDFSFANVLSSNYVVEIDSAQLPAGWQVVIGQNAVPLSGCNAAGEADLLLDFCLTSSLALTVQVCEGAFYDYNGVQIAAGDTEVFTFQNVLGCDSVVTVTVNELAISSSNLNISTCPGTFYDYNGTLLAPGDSEVFTLTNAAGCDSLVTVLVGELPADYLVIDAIVCEGDSFLYDGVWIPANSTQIFTFINQYGCESFAEVAVGTFGPIEPSSLSAVVCPGETFQYNGQQLVAGASEVFTLTNIWGCDSIVTVTVTGLSVEPEFLEITLCPGETYSFNGTEIRAGDTVVFQFTTPEGCDSTVTVAVNALPEATFDVLAETSCATSPTGSLTVTNTAGGLPPYRYSLDGSAFQDEVLFEKLAAGDYTVYLEDSNGCIFDQRTEITEIPRLEVALADGVLPCDSSAVILEVATNQLLKDLEIKWFNGDTSWYTTTSAAGPVWVEVTNECETLRREAAVNWQDEGIGTNFVYVPNVIKPASNDPDNSEFKPYFKPNLTLLDYRFEVFDRWGNKLFSTEQRDLGWRGAFRSDDMNPGVYVWYMKATVAFCGQVREMLWSGDVTVVR